VEQRRTYVIIVYSFVGFLFTRGGTI